MNTVQKFRVLLLSFLILGVMGYASSALADFTPTSPAFPHGDGITRSGPEDHSSCGAGVGTGCPKGLSFPSFNNFTDTTIEGAPFDERRFVQVQNLTTNPGGTLSNSVTASPGDFVYMRAFVHNNGWRLESGDADPSVTAENVRLGMYGFSDIGSGNYSTAAGTSISLQKFIASTNTTPSEVTDDAFVTSATGGSIKLVHYSGAHLEATKGHVLSASSFFSSGTNVGSIQGCMEDSFYVTALFQVESANTTPVESDDYDLGVVKLVDTVLDVTRKPGDEVTYTLIYRNNLASNFSIQNLRIVDDFDEDSMEITEMPSETGCTIADANGNDVLLCALSELPPNTIRYFSYKARIKDGASETIPNTVDIFDSGNMDNDVYTTNNRATATVYIDPVCGSNARLYEESSSGYSSVDFCAVGNQSPVNPAFPTAGGSSSWNCTYGTKTISCEAQKKRNGQCGSYNGVYAISDTQYTSGTGYCSAGTADSNPSFPLGNSTESTWKCNGVNGGDTVDCSAVRTNSYDLSIEKEVEGMKEFHADRNATVEFTLEYANDSGSSIAAENVVITDDYDATKITVVDATLPAGCTDDNDKITCTIGNLAIAESGTISYSATLHSSFTQGTTVNTASIASSPDNDSIASNNTSSATVVVKPECGDRAGTYSSGYAQGSSYCAAGTADSTPTFPTEGNTASWNCTNAPADPVSCSVTNPDTLDVSITKSVTPAAALPGDTVTYTVTYQNNTSSITAAGVEIIDSYDDANIENIQVVSKPAQANCSITTESIPSTDPLAQILGVVQNIPVLKCVHGSLQESEGVQTLQYTATIKNSTTEGTVINNAAAVSATNEPEANFGNNTATAQVLTTADGVCNTENAKVYTHLETSYSSADFCTSGTASPLSPAFPAEGGTVTWQCIGANGGTTTQCAASRLDAAATQYDLVLKKYVNNEDNEVSVAAGSTVTYRIDYENAATSTVSTGLIQIVDTYDSSKITINANSLPAECSDDGAGTITCSNLPSLNAGQTAQLDYTATLNAGFTTGVATNTAVATPANAGETQTANNTDPANVRVVDPALNCSFSPSSTTVTGSGTVALNWSIIGDYSSASINQSVGAVQTRTGAVNVQVSSSTVFTMTVNGTNGGTATCTMNVTVESTSNPSPRRGGGGGCSLTSDIDLSIQKYISVNGGAFVSAKSKQAAMALSPVVSNAVQYKVVVSNAGSAYAENVKIKDVFSSQSGFTQINITNVSGASYDVDSNLFSIPGNVNANGYREFTYTANVAAGSDGFGKNIARIESFTKPRTTCPVIKSEKGVGRSSLAYIKVGESAKFADYRLTKRVNKRNVKAGDEVIYTLALKNTGEVDMKNVYLEDRFPAEYLKPIESLEGRLKNSRTLSFKRKFLPIGDTFKVKVRMIVREGVPEGTNITNVLTASSENVTINDIDEETITVTQEAVTTPTCKSGYSWDSSKEKCKLVNTGTNIPFVPLGLALLAFAAYIRRSDILSFIRK